MDEIRKHVIKSFLPFLITKEINTNTERERYGNYVYSFPVDQIYTYTFRKYPFSLFSPERVEYAFGSDVEIWEDVYVRSTKLNPDGSLQLDGAGKVIYGHDPVSRPKLIASRQYVGRRIAKGDEFADKTADVDGVLVVRVA